MDTFTYNSITIQNPNFESIDATPVYDEGDQTVQYTRIVIVVTGTVVPNVDDLTAPVQFDRIRETLLKPRGSLTVTVGGTTLLRQLTGTDDLGGPKPRNCKITEIVGSAFALVRFEIEVNMYEGCWGTTLSNIISHRFSVTHTLDERFMTTRTVRGLLRVRENAGINNPDLLRGLVTPGVPSGFLRKSMNFLVQDDGLVLRYEVVDEEVYRSLNSGARCSARFTVQLQNLIWYNHFSIEIQGRKDQGKLAMFNQALSVARQRMSFGDANKERLVSAAIIEELFENTIRVNLTTQLTDYPSSSGNAFFPANTRVFGPLVDSGAEALGPYGTALIAAAKQAFYNPCTASDTPTSPGNTTAGPSITPSVQTASTPVIDTSSPTGSAGGNVSSEQVANPYTFYNETITLDERTGMVVLPCTKMNTPATVYQVHTPFLTLHQEGSATRVGVWPVSPVPATTFGKLLSRKVITHEPQLEPDKTTLRYSISWVYDWSVDLSTSNYTTRGGYSDIDGSNLIVPAPASPILTSQPGYVTDDGWAERHIVVP